MAVEWFEADVDSGQWARLVEYDHHRFPIGGRPAVLITYLVDGFGEADSAQTVLAVRHGAADRHPELPERLLDLVDRLSWRAAAAPAGQ